MLCRADSSLTLHVTAASLACVEFAFLFVWKLFSFFSFFEPAGVAAACSCFMVPSALHEVCLWTVGFLSLELLFHLLPELMLTNYSCGVRQGVAAASSLQGKPQCEWRLLECIMYIMQVGVLCEIVCYSSTVCECVCMRCNSHFKSKSLTAALMPAASQVMKGLVPVAADTSIILFLPLPIDAESITASVCHSLSLTLACIIKVYFPKPRRWIPSCSFPISLPLPTQM